MSLCRTVTLVLLLQVIVLWGMDQAVGSMLVFALGMTGVFLADLLRTRDWLQPRILVAAFLWIYSVPLVIATLLVDPVRPELTSEALAGTSVVVGLVYLALYLADATPVARDVRSWVREHVLSDGMIRSMFKVGLLAAGPVWLVTTLWLWRAGVYELATKTELKELLTGSTLGAVDSLFSASLVLLVMVGVMAAPAFLRQYRSQLSIAVIGLVLYFLPLVYVSVMLVDRRRWGAVAVLGLLVAWHVAVQRVPRRALVPFAMALVLSMTVVHLHRGGGHVEAAADLIHPHRHGELRVVHGSIIAVDDYLQAESPLWGKSYLNSYRTILPRVLVERPAVLADTQPDSLIEVDPSLWYSAREDLERALAGHHFGFSSLAEAHLNWPYIGPFVLVFVFVYLLRLLYVDRHERAFLCGLYVILVTNAFWLIRSTLPGVAKDLIIFVAIPLVLAVVAVRCVPRSLREPAVERAG